MKKLMAFIKKYKLYYLLLLPVLYVIFYLNTSSKALADVDAFLTSSQEVTVTLGKTIVFTPEEPNKSGIIFYPGGKVDPKAYAPTLYNLAKEGYTCYLIKMPFNLAVFNAGAGSKVVQAHPEIENWVIGGHSLGGAMASKEVFDNPQTYKGIFFLASYPIESTPLNGIESLSSLSLYGEKDGLVDVNRVVDDQKLLPVDQTTYVIQGGNHAQFGYYGEQKGDQTATIDREQQQALVVEQILNWLNKQNPKQ